MNGKGDRQRIRDRTRTTKAQFDDEFDRIFAKRINSPEQKAQDAYHEELGLEKAREDDEIRQVEIDEYVKGARWCGLTDEQIDAILDDRYGTSLKEQEE